MPFGLTNAAQSFQYLMHTVCQGLDFVFFYLNDVLVASRTKADHQKHLCSIFSRLQDYGLVINHSKCIFGVASIDFQGHHVDQHSASPLPVKVKPIQDFPQPQMVKGMQEFWGMLNFYHCFVLKAAAIMQTLFASTKRKINTVEWSPDKHTAFSVTKQALAATTLLVHPHVTVPTSTQWMPLLFLLLALNDQLSVRADIEECCFPIRWAVEGTVLDDMVSSLLRLAALTC